MSQSIEEQIEPLIDAYGLANVLEGIINICQDKAEQDDASAARWLRRAEQLAVIASAELNDEFTDEEIVDQLEDTKEDKP